MTRFAEDAFAPIVVATRNDLDESVHQGAGIVIAADGAVTASVGDPELAIYPRSALKPFQASAMVRAGLDLPFRLLAVVAASHSGEQRHLDAVSEILDRHDLTVADLANTPDHPYGAAARSAAIATATDESPLQQNCSGKHAGMLATCRVNGWPIDGYLDPVHPMQEVIRDEIDRLADRPGGAVVHVGVDGCGAPTHVMALVDVARALRTMMLDGSDVCQSMMAFPGLVGGVDRDVTIWTEAVPGLVGKEGADGVMVAALVDGRAGALKIADGSDRARQAASVELLGRMGVDVDGRHSAVRDRLRIPVLGHGVDVGSLHAVPWT